jgi:hypothetical protein
LEVRVGSEGLEGLDGTKLSKHPKLSKLIFFTLELELQTRTLPPPKSINWQHFIYAVCSQINIDI